MENKLSFEFNVTTFDFTNEFLPKGRKLKDEEASVIVDFLNFFKSLDDKSILLNEINKLACNHSDEKN